MPSTPTRQKRPSLRSAPTRGEGLSDRMNSYDAARLTHTRVVEARVLKTLDCYWATDLRTLKLFG